MKQESINENNLTEFDSLLAESINNSKLKEGTIIKGKVAEIEDEAIIVDIGAKVEEYLKGICIPKIKRIINRRYYRCVS